MLYDSYMKEMSPQVKKIRIEERNDKLAKLGFFGLMLLSIFGKYHRAHSEEQKASPKNTTTASIDTRTDEIPPNTIAYGDKDFSSNP